MISAIIVDDKAVNIETLQRLIERHCPQVTIVATAEDTDSAYTTIRSLKPDLVFLDIEMPGGSGFDLLRRFQPVPFGVIFVTAFSHYAVQAFREHAVDYLLKPVDIGTLREAVARAEQQLRLQQPTVNIQQLLQHPALSTRIQIPVQDGYLFILNEEVSYCEGAGSYSNFHLTDRRKLLVSLRMKECEDLLPQPFFLRVHHSFIINLRQVARYIRGRGGQVQMRDGTLIEVSASRKNAFLEAMKQV